MTVPFSGLADPTAGAKTVKVGAYSIDNAVLSSIKKASQSTGVDFGYLMAQAAQESSFQADAKASSSSATGLYQFLDSTWLSMMRTHGAKHGFADLAERIQTDSRGGVTVADPSVKKAILDLRKDPKVSAVIGAEFALSNKEQLEGDLGHKVGSTELYLAHFLGAGGASRFLKAIERNAATPAADLLPQAAAANRNVFYDRATGQPRTVGDIYKLFARSIETKQTQFADAHGLAPQDAAPAPSAPTTVAASTLGAPGPAGFLKSAPSTTSSISGPDISGPSLSLLSILAMAALDAADPSTPFGTHETADGRTIHSDGRVTRKPQAPGLATKPQFDHSI
jgi:hypothetical protein